MDLDLDLSLALLDTKRYEDLTLRLCRADFKPDENEEGNPMRMPSATKGIGPPLLR